MESEELIQCAGRPDTHPPMELPQSAFDPRWKNPFVCLACQNANKRELMRRYRTVPHCQYCLQPLAPDQKTYCSAACREKARQRRKRSYPHEGKTPRRKPETIKSRYLQATETVRRDVAIGFCRWCGKPVSYGQLRFCDENCRQQFFATQQYVDTHHTRVTPSQTKGRRGSPTIRITKRTDYESYLAIIGRAVWHSMGRPKKITFTAKGYRVYITPGDEYTISGTKGGSSLHVAIGTPRLMELGLRPIRYNVVKHDDVWYMNPAEE